MKDSAEKLFGEWFKEKSMETGNWSFDIEEAAKDAFFTGFSFAYPAMKELLFDVARYMDIRVVQKGEEDVFLALIEIDGRTKGSVGDSEATAIYSLVKGIANGDDFVKVDELTDKEKDDLGLS
jgi:hypothetical protein